MPALSIIVPIYNVEEYLSDCIRSLLNQTYFDFELILINDGSTDKSREICTYYAIRDKRITLINKENGGVSSARNLGIDISKGKYIGFVDPDDTVEPKMFELLIDNAEKYKTDMVICPFNIINLKTKNITTSKIWKCSYCKINQNIISNSFFEDIIENNFSFLSCCNKLYRSSIFKDFNIKFEETKDHGEDARLNLKLLPLLNSLVYIDEPVYNYFVRYRDSLTKVFRENFYVNILDYKNLLLETCDIYHLNSCKKKIRDKFIRESINFMHQVIESQLPNKKKFTIISLIINSEDFHKDIYEYKSISLYFKLLQIISLYKRDRLFYIVLKTRFLCKKLII